MGCLVGKGLSRKRREIGKILSQMLFLSARGYDVKLCWLKVGDSKKVDNCQ